MVAVNLAKAVENRHQDIRILELLGAQQSSNFDLWCVGVETLLNHWKVFCSISSNARNLWPMSDVEQYEIVRFQLIWIEIHEIQTQIDDGTKANRPQQI